LKEANEMFPADAAIAQAYAQSYTKYSPTVKTDMKLARELYEKAVQVNERYQHTYQSWAMSEWLVGEDIDRARDLFQQGIWSGPSTKQASKIFSSWAHMEAKEDQNMELARSLYTCAYKIKPRSTKILLNWARDEETFGEIARSEELRAMSREIASEFLPEVGASSSQQSSSRQVLDANPSTLWPSNIASEISSEANGAAKVLAQFITEWNLYFDKAIREDKTRRHTKMIVQKQFQ
jgi:tetratricopeptide (TPR) repeat protein